MTASSGTGATTAASGSAASASGAGGAASTSSSASGGGGAPPGDAVYVAAVTADGPMAWFRLAETSAVDPVVDQIGMKNGAFTGTLMVGAASPFSDTTDTAVRFQGGEAEVLHAELAIPDAAHSIEAWVLAETVDTNHRGIINVEWPDGMSKQGYRLYVYLSGGAPKVVYGRINALDDQDMIVDFPNDGQWHHLVGTYDGTTGICTYVDAVSTCMTRPKIALTGTPTGVVIGARTFSTPTTTFRGSIDEVALYDEVLTGAQVTAHFQARTAP